MNIMFINHIKTKTMNYTEQNKAVQKLLKELSKKSKKFAKENKNRHFGDLQYVLSSLKNINTFLK